MNVMLSTLRLVYPPVSNQEAEWLISDPDVEAVIRTSDFYMIAARAEARFDCKHLSQSGLTVRVPIKAGDSLDDEFTLDVAVLAQSYLPEMPHEINARAGDKLIQIFANSDEEIDFEPVEPFAWYTTEKLIHDRSRDEPGIVGFDRYREFSTYELLYVGIAKSTDTFERLFKGAHHARQRILSNEWPKMAGARVTDEMILLPFRLEPLIVRTLGGNDSLTAITADEWRAYRKTAVIDAEKAFIHLLDPRYNVEKFAAYPRGVDGLYGHGHQRYGYVIAENLTLTSGDTALRGSWRSETGTIGNEADVLAIDGDTVFLHRADNS